MAALADNPMTTIEPEPTAPPPHLPFQFSLRALLLLFVVLASSLAVFGGWGLVVFGLVVGVAICVREVKSLTCVRRQLFFPLNNN